MNNMQTNQANGLVIEQSVQPEYVDVKEILRKPELNIEDVKQEAVPEDASNTLMYKCQVCTHETKQKRSLKRHMLVHEDPSEITMYKCTMCMYETNFKRNLKGHMETHQSPPEVARCPLCNYEVKQKRNLQRHMLCHKSPEETTMYKCTQCSYEAKQKQYLKRHKLVHEITPKDALEITTYKCDLCKFASKRKGNLKKHILSHTKTTLFKCEKCTYKTTYRRCFEHHCRLSHKDASEVTVSKFETDSLKIKCDSGCHKMIGYMKGRASKECDDIVIKENLVKME